MEFENSSGREIDAKPALDCSFLTLHRIMQASSNNANGEMKVSTSVAGSRPDRDSKGRRHIEYAPWEIEPLTASSAGLTERKISIDRQDRAWHSDAGSDHIPAAL